MPNKIDKQIYLSTGGDDHFLLRLLHEINHADCIDMAVAFIRSTGLYLIYQALLDALEREQSVKLRIITGDYLEVTEPQALRELMLLQEQGAEVKVYESKGKQSFHMKAYIFISQTKDDIDSGCAFIGSSNISKTALTEGLEWNLRVDNAENPSRFSEIRSKFEQLFFDKNAVPLSHEWIDVYQARYSNSQIVQKPEPIDLPELPPVPTNVQTEALDALHKTRDEGYRRALVVLATGMGKTWLSAFDAKAINAKRILFVAHREEILDQAERTFVRIFPESKIGRYTGKQRELNVDMLFASVQTLGKTVHLDQFAKDYFDYIVIDEFHHAAARTYQQLLGHFHPRFLLGLTATPERTDQVDILHLCDDNLVYRQGLADGIEKKILCPFRYYGIGDEAVDYKEIPWRNHRFDPEALVNQLATQARARHVLRKWRELHQTRTLAFCVSRRHADFMADYFNRHDVPAVSVHSKSEVRRNEALAQLNTGDVSVVFSVDLFNEGVDVPAIDTVLMLRPTESKILFQQQLGRGLRFSLETDKSHLIIIDFIGNHISFFKKAEALFHVASNNSARRDFIDKIEANLLPLPEGCFVNYDVAAIDFLRALVSTQIDAQLEIYRGLRDSLGRRPTLSEFYMGGGAVTTVRDEHDKWLGLVESEGDLDGDEQKVFDQYQEFFREVEVTSMTKSFKMIMLDAFIELNGFVKDVTVTDLANTSFDVLQRKRRLIPDLPQRFQIMDELDKGTSRQWQAYWRKNPIAAWIGDSRQNSKSFFSIKNGIFNFNFEVHASDAETLAALTQELINFRLMQYEARSNSGGKESVFPVWDEEKQQVPYFSDLKIACGYFRTSEHESENIEYINIPTNYGKLDPARHFIARASGDSMDGTKNPIKDGDYLLLELVSSGSAGSISNSTMAIERQDAIGHDQYLLRDVRKRDDGNYDLVARNPDYPVFQADDSMRTFARLKNVIDPLSIALHESFLREMVPGLFGLEFNVGAWQSGHVTVKNTKDQYLFVTLNKQGKQQQHQYHDYFINKTHFHWQSQNSTSPESGKGKNIINHEQNGSVVHLFVRKNKLDGKTAAPFIYCGKLIYLRHTGSRPMSVVWVLDEPLTDELFEYFK